MSIVVDIAEAVVTELNGESFSIPFTAQRSYLPVYDLREMSELKVTVIPRSVTSTLASREASDELYAVMIGMQKKLEPEELDDVDALVTLMEELGVFLTRRTLSEMPDAQWISNEIDPLFVGELMDKLRQFTSVLTATYRLIH